MVRRVQYGSSASPALETGMSPQQMYHQQPSPCCHHEPNEHQTAAFCRCCRGRVQLECIMRASLAQVQSLLGQGVAQEVLGGFHLHGRPLESGDRQRVHRRLSARPASTCPGGRRAAGRRHCAFTCCRPACSGPAPHRLRRSRYRATSGTAGTCEACGWRTDWEAEEEPCHAAQGKEPDELLGLSFPPAKVRRVDTADRCHTCTRPGVSVLGGLASSQAASPGAPASSQAAAALPPSCVMCPVLHPPDSVSLRQVQSPVSQQTLERLCWFADQCTLERGRGRAASTG